MQKQADGPRYKQMGNAVTVNVAEWLGRRLADVG
jgi:site-specific DNA-cytosine methylase